MIQATNRIRTENHWSRFWSASRFQIFCKQAGISQANRLHFSSAALENTPSLCRGVLMQTVKPLHRVWTMILLVFGISGSLSGAAELQQESTAQTGYVIHQRVEEVLLYCAVFDHQNRLVNDLERSAFTVREDGTPVTISSFSHKDLPVSLALVLDESGSMADKRAAIASAAIDLIKASNPEDETSITNFAEAAYLDQDFTDNVPKLESALAQSKTVSGGTALFDTLIGAADHLAIKGRHSKQVIVVVTDGRDNTSAADLAAAVHRVQSTNGPVIYTIGLLYDVPNGDARHARQDLQRLSDETGGMAFFPSSVQEVDKIAAEVARDIRNQYTIAYHPPENAKQQRYRNIKVEATDSNGRRLQIRTRKGYERSSAPPAN